MTIAIDPFFNPKTKVQPAQVTPDLVLVTHGHEDHLGSALDLKAPILGIYEMAQHLTRAGAAEAVGINIGGTYKGGGTSVTMTFAAHSSGCGAISAKSMFYGECGNPVGYVIDDGKRKLYHAGDTGLFGDMKAVIGDVHRPDIALLPIGGTYTMDPAQAAIATDWLQVADVVPMHYGTFPVIEQDPNVFVAEVKKRCKAKVHVMQVDSSIELSTTTR